MRRRGPSLADTLLSPSHLPFASQVANADAIELFFNVLQYAAEADALWGLAVFHRLTRASMANLAAAASTGLGRVLIEWFARPGTAPCVQARVTPGREKMKV